MLFVHKETGDALVFLFLWIPKSMHTFWVTFLLLLPQSLKHHRRKFVSKLEVERFHLRYRNLQRRRKKKGQSQLFMSLLNLRGQRSRTGLGVVVEAWVSAETQTFCLLLEMSQGRLLQCCPFGFKQNQTNQNAAKFSDWSWRINSRDCFLTHQVKRVEVDHHLSVYSVIHVQLLQDLADVGGVATDAEEQAVFAGWKGFNFGGDV